MKTVLLGPQRFRTTVGAVIRTVAPEGAVATVTAGWRNRESDTDELGATLDGRGRHLHIYGRLADVRDSDRRFAAAALAPSRRRGRTGRDLLAPAAAGAR